MTTENFPDSENGTAKSLGSHRAWYSCSKGESDLGQSRRAGGGPDPGVTDRSLVLFQLRWETSAGFFTGSNMIRFAFRKAPHGSESGFQGSKGREIIVILL